MWPDWLRSAHTSSRVIAYTVSGTAGTADRQRCYDGARGELGRWKGDLSSQGFCTCGDEEEEGRKDEQEDEEEEEEEEEEGGR